MTETVMCVSRAKRGVPATSPIRWWGRRRALTPLADNHGADRRARGRPRPLRRRSPSSPRRMGQADRSPDEADRPAVHASLRPVRSLTSPCEALSVGFDGGISLPGATQASRLRSSAASGLSPYGPMGNLQASLLSHFSIAPDSRGVCQSCRRRGGRSRGTVSTTSARPSVAGRRSPSRAAARARSVGGRRFVRSDFLTFRSNAVSFFGRGLVHGYTSRSFHCAPRAGQSPGRRKLRLGPSP
jgi:hypothetical protein